MIKKILIISLMLVFMVTLPAFGLLEIADEEAMTKLEEVISQYVDDRDITLQEAWVIDFPSVSEHRFYRVIALLDNGKQKQDFYVNTESFEVVHEDVILELQQQEADTDEPVFRITSTNKDGDFVQAPEGSEVGIVSTDGKSSSDLNSLYWGVPSGLLVVLLSVVILKKRN